MTGVFISIEGGEGAGKTTQIALLADRLRASGRQVVVTREPGGCPVAEALREVLLGTEGKQLAPLARLWVVSAARQAHCQQVIQPALMAGAVVLCDRFHDSTHAYQGVEGIDSATITALTHAATGGILPSLTLWLDIPPDEGLRRVAKRGDTPTFYDAASLAFHTQLRTIFTQRQQAEPNRIQRIDASAATDRVADAIWQVVVAVVFEGV